MKPDFETLIRKHMSVNSPDIPNPSLELVRGAREKVMKRRKPTAYKNTLWFLDIFRFEITIYKAGLAALIIIFILLYSGTPKSDNLVFTEHQLLENNSASSSTVLASLSQYNNNHPTVSSSTVLTSIITFASKN